MKVWFEKSYNFPEDSNVNVGIHWYKHKNPRFGGGFTVHFIFLKWNFVLTAVKDFPAYQNRFKQTTRKFKRLSIKNDP